LLIIARQDETIPPSALRTSWLQARIFIKLRITTKESTIRQSKVWLVGGGLLKAFGDSFTPEGKHIINNISRMHRKLNIIHLKIFYIILLIFYTVAWHTAMEMGPTIL
jgi:hypothetical protein